MSQKVILGEEMNRERMCVVKMLLVYLYASGNVHHCGFRLATKAMCYRSDEEAEEPHVETRRRRRQCCDVSAVEREANALLEICV